MPLLTPEISKVLEIAGLDKPADEDLYAQHELSDADCVRLLSGIANGGGSEALRLKAVETAMKAKKMLSSETGTSSTQINIIIQDPQGPKGINPILIPREVQVSQ